MSLYQKFKNTYESQVIAEMEMSFLRNFHYWLHQKFRCSQWSKFRQKDISISVMSILSMKKKHKYVAEFPKAVSKNYNQNDVIFVLLEANCLLAFVAQDPS